MNNMIEGFIRMMNSERGFTGPVNMGNPGEFTMQKLVEKVLRLEGGKSKLRSIRCRLMIQTASAGYYTDHGETMLGP